MNKKLFEQWLLDHPIQVWLFTLYLIFLMIFISFVMLLTLLSGIGVNTLLIFDMFLGLHTWGVKEGM